jgi:hypothetical protein
MNPTVGYPETVFSAANFFGPTPPAQQGNGPIMNSQSGSAGVQPIIQWHAVTMVSVLIIGGYLLWHFVLER